MTILVIGKFYIEAFALHIAETLRDMGHEVLRFDPSLKVGILGGRIGHRFDQARALMQPALDAVPALRARRMRSLRRVASSRPIDVAIVCHDFLLSDEVAALKCITKATVTLWFRDSLSNFGRAFFGSPLTTRYFLRTPTSFRR